MENPTAQDQAKSSTKKKRKNKKKSGKTTAGTDSNTPITHTEHESLHQNGDNEDVEDHESNASEAEAGQDDSPKVNGVDDEHAVPDEGEELQRNGTKVMSVSEELEAATARFDAMVKDRERLREEVTRLRESLEETVSKHENEISELQTQLQDTQTQADTSEENYQNLLARVEVIRTQLGERMQREAEAADRTNAEIEKLKEEKSELEEQKTAQGKEIEELKSINAQRNKDLDDLRERNTLSQSNWTQEREDRVEQEKYLREEFEEAKQAMHDWEALAMEERSIRRDLSDKVADLDDQLTSTKAEHERTLSDLNTSSATVDSLQKAIVEIQSARRTELRDLVESTQRETASLKTLLEETKTQLTQSQTSLTETQAALDRALPFEKEVKEKNLLIGKLRHEAVILSDHLTKALRFLRKGKPEDNVDRQIVTNHFLHFLALDRSDPKKFQILQLIGALLGWTDEQKEQAGLQRVGGTPATPVASNSWGSLRLPRGDSFLHKTPSSPALSNLGFGPASATGQQADGYTESPSGKESLAELWQNFLEQEAGSSQTSGRSRVGSRTTSVSTGIGLMSPPIPGTTAAAAREGNADKRMEKG